MDDLKFGELMDELVSLKKVLLYQSLTVMFGITKPNDLLDFLRSFNLDDKEIKLLLAVKYGNKYAENVFKKALKE